MRRLLLFIPLLALVFTLRPLGVQAADFQTDSSQVTISSPIHSDTFAASSTVDVTAPITGEVFLAGSTVSVTKRISRSAYIVGSTITVSQGAGYDLFAAGETITLSGTYGNDVYVAGATVNINKGTVINGDLWVEGGTLNLNGTVNGSAHLDIDTLNSNAVIGGSVSGNIATTTFTGGSIGGTFYYKSNTAATGLNTVKIAGDISRSTPSSNTATAWDIIKAALTAIVATLLLGSLLAYRFPSTVSAFIDEATGSYFKMMLYGLVWLILVPLICFSLAVTIIGWKIALFLLLLYALFLLLAGVLSMFVVGKWIYRRFVPHHRDNIWDYLITGILLVYILGAIPYVTIVSSAVFGIFAFLPSLGALGARMVERE